LFGVTSDAFLYFTKQGMNRLDPCLYLSAVQLGVRSQSLQVRNSKQGAVVRDAGSGDQARPVPLAEFVSALREELRAAQAAYDPGLQFAVGPVSVEFMVVTKREGGPEAKVRFWVVEAGASARLSREATQKMSLTLTPVDEHGRPIYVLDPVMEPPP
jgi:hypothetical protein